MKKNKLKILLTATALIATGAIALDATAGKGPKKNSKTSDILTMNALNAGRQGQSGTVLDLTGDGRKDLVVGAPYAKKNKNLGALLIYEAGKSGFSKRPSRIIRGKGNLGWSVVSIGNHPGDTCFAASAFSGSGKNASLAGTVTLYSCDRKPSVQAILEGEDAMDKFGFAMATGDLNGDGDNELIVGSPMHSPSPDLYQKGALYVFWGPGHSQASQLKIPATSTVNGIGISLATGDINDDGIDDLLAGASGKVAGYYGSTEFNTTALAGPDVLISGRDRDFGRAIAVTSDVNHDRFNDIAIGARKAVIGGQVDSGRLFIVQGGSGGRTINGDEDSADILAKVDGEPLCGLFGSVIQPVGDLDGDGIKEVAVSAVHADGDWPMTGAVYIFSGSDLASTETSIASAMKIPGKARDMHLGEFLAPLLDGTLLAAGAPTERRNTGTVRILKLNDLD